MHTCMDKCTYIYIYNTYIITVMYIHTKITYNYIHTCTYAYMHGINALIYNTYIIIVMYIHTKII